MDSENEERIKQLMYEKYHLKTKLVSSHLAVLRRHDIMLPTAIDIRWPHTRLEPYDFSLIRMSLFAVIDFCAG